MSVSISDIIAWCNIDFKDDLSNPLYYAGNLYLNGEKVTDLVIPEGVNILKDNVFSGCTGLTSVTIPNGVTSIGENAFYGCTGLLSVSISDIIAWCNLDFKNDFSNPLCYAGNLYLNGEKVIDLVIPEGVDIIKSRAFYGYIGFTSVTIPNSVTSIGVSAFEGCSELDTIICLATTPPFINSWTFDSYDCILLIPKGTLDAYENHKYWNSFKNIKEIKENYTITTSVNDEIMGSVSDGGVYEEDSEITLIATANDGYCFMKWSDGNIENPRTVTVTKDFTYTANFYKKITVLTSVYDESMGTVSGAGVYCMGSTIELIAIANDGYRFVEWSDGYIQNPRIIIVKEDIDLMAIFESDGTPVNNIGDSSVQVYVREGVFYIEDINEDYRIFDSFGRLVYVGRDAQLQLPCGVYLVVVGDEVQKVVI